MAGELKHKSPGVSLSQAEYEAIDSHETEGAVAGDILVHDGTYWAKSAPLWTTGALTYYVSTTGSDSNAGTAAAPFRTIKHVIGDATNPGILPKIIKHQVIVNLADGTYDEPIELYGYICVASGAYIPLVIQGVIAAIVSYIAILYCVGSIQVGYQVQVNTTSVNSVDIRNSVGYFLMRGLTITQTNAHSGLCAGGPGIIEMESCTISNHTIGMEAIWGSKVISANCSGSGNGQDYNAGDGCDIAIKGPNMLKSAYTNTMAGMVETDGGMVRPHSPTQIIPLILTNVVKSAPGTSYVEISALYRTTLYWVQGGPRNIRVVVSVKGDEAGNDKGIQIWNSTDSIQLAAVTWNGSDQQNGLVGSWASNYNLGRDTVIQVRVKGSSGTENITIDKVELQFNWGIFTT